MTLLASDPHDQRLVRAVHPGDWKNAAPAPRYDLVVLGGGTAGLVCAAGAAGLGAKVALVERHLLGGDCLNYGCVPSKALIHSARQSPRPDFGAAMERLRRLRADIAVHDSAERFRGLGVDVFLGEARFGGPEEVRVADAVLRFRRAVVATGARPAVPAVPGLAEAGLLTNETVFTLTSLPKRLAVLGAGPIGCELAQAFARLGSAVTVLTDGKRPLPREDADAAPLVVAALERDGVRFVSGATLTGARREGRGKVLSYDAAGRAEELAADEVLVAVGRAPNVEGLGLEAAGVRFDARRGVEVDDSLRTANPRVYASGDCCSAYKFTHAADAMSRLVIQNALFPGPRKRFSSLVIPWCTYTDPEVAGVGLTAAAAAELGLEARTFVQPFTEVDRAVLDGETTGFLKVVAGPKGRILGAALVARHAGETIGELALAMTAGLGLADLARTIHPYPTQAEALKKVGDQYMRTKLSPAVKSLFRRWFGLSRGF